MEPASSEQKKLVPGSIGSPSGEPVNSMNANEVDSYKDTFLETWFSTPFSKHTKLVTGSIGSASGEPVNSIIATEANSYEDPFSESWVPALSDYSKLATGSIGSPSERVNYMIGNHGNALDEPVKQVANQVEKLNSVLGKHSRAEPTKVNPSRRAPKRPKWGPLPDLYTIITHHVESIDRLAQRRLKNQGSEDKGIIKQYKQYIETQLKQISVINAKGFLYSETLPIAIFKVNSSSTKKPYQYQIRPTYDSEDKSLIRPQRLRFRIAQIFHALNLYHNLLSLGGLDHMMLGVTGNVHEDLIKWFFTIMFKGTPGRWPVLGQIRLNNLPRDSIEFDNFFPSKPQRYLMDLFLYEEKIGRKMSFTAAIKLMGYWYEESTSGVFHTNALGISPHLPPPFDQETYETAFVKALGNVHYKRYNTPT
ncbi:hypothetical protein PtB15_18B228 [Puccinia triticina]|nr:hypothetical protein PtB15_18B228 [Puccinia triticina]